MSSIIRNSKRKLIPMTNDFMFHMVLQESNEALKGLVASFLHLPGDEIKSVVVTNPIEYGSNVTGKGFVLDLKVTLNENTTVNLEMQVEDKHNWDARSLSYLCRTYDSLNRGSDYKDARAVIHIGFLKYTLFKDHPEFYATYRLMNEKDHYVFSDRFRLSVVELNHINMATEEDIKWKLDKWARLIRESDREKILEIAGGDKAMTAAAKTIEFFNEDFWAREQMIRRQEIEAYEKRRDEESKKDKATIKEQRKELARIKAEVADQAAVIAIKDAAITDLTARIAELEAAAAKQV